MSISSSPNPAEPRPGIIGFINRYPVPFGIGALVIAASSLLISFHKTEHNRAYYTVDDGTTIFTHDVEVPPFDVGGKEAVGAMMYSCDGGKTRFVGYLYRYTAEGKIHAQQMLEQHRAGPPVGMEVKRPGTTNWTLAMMHGPPGTKSDGASITNVKCPDGTGVPFMLNP